MLFQAFFNLPIFQSYFLKRFNTMLMQLNRLNYIKFRGFCYYNYYRMLISTLQDEDDTQPPGIFMPVKLSHFWEDDCLTKAQIYISQYKTPGFLYIFDQYLLIEIFGQFYKAEFDLNLGFCVQIEKLEITFYLGQKQDQIKGTINFPNVSSLNCIFEYIKKKLCQLNFSINYKILEKIGEGKSATVYKIQRKVDGKFFAAKITKNFSTLIQQINIISILEHPNLIHFQEFYIENHQAYIVMDFEDGGNLYELLKSNDFYLDERMRLKIYLDVLNGLQFLRLKGIVHRDIKPQNIIFSKTDGNYKIADFGLATLEGKNFKSIVGTPGYLSPQLIYQKEEKITSIKSDIYSAGLVFYELITGEPYYKGRDTNEILKDNMKGKNIKSVKNSKMTQLEKKLLHFMIRKDSSCRKDSCEILKSPVMNKLVKIHNFRGYKESITDSTRKSKQQDDDENQYKSFFLSAVKKLMKIRSSSK